MYVIVSLLSGGFRGRVHVVRVIYLQSFAPHHRGFPSHQGICWILLIHLAYGKSMVLLTWPFVFEIMHGGAPDVFFHHWKLENRYLIFTVIGRRKTQTKILRCPFVPEIMHERTPYVFPQFVLHAIGFYQNSVIFTLKWYLWHFIALKESVTMYYKTEGVSFWHYLFSSKQYFSKSQAFKKTVCLKYICS